MAYPFTFFGHNIVLVDTPGFDDTYRSDADVLESLVAWLTTSYQAGKKLSGLVYLHRISDIRMQGSALRNLRVFRDLCGKDCFKNVVLCTTFWDVVEKEAVAEARLNELVSNEGFWGGMIDNGSKVFKGSLSRVEAIYVIYELISGQRLPLQIQKEIVDENKSLQETSAVSTLMNLRLERQREEHKESLAEERRRFEEDIKVRERTHSEDLEGMRKAYHEKLAKLEEAKERLRVEINAKESQPSSPVLPVHSPITPQPTPVTPMYAPSTPVTTHATPVSKTPLYRASTIATDQKTFVDVAVGRRMELFENFKAYMTATIRVLENGKRNGQVKCDFFGRKSCYMMVCANCFRNIGGGECFSMSSVFRLAQ